MEELAALIASAGSLSRGAHARVGVELRATKIGRDLGASVVGFFVAAAITTFWVS